MPPTLTPEHDALLQEICGKYDAADQTHAKERRRWDELDSLYHSRNDWMGQLRESSKDERRNVIGDGMKEFGAELFIPFSFTVVETVLPRLISNRPKPLVLPRTKASEPNVEPMRLTVDAQQEQCDYEMKLQTTAKSGLIYGLGVQKGPFWRRDERTVERVQQRPVEKGVGPFKTRTLEWVPVTETETVWDDPDLADVSVYDFLWDPYGDSPQTCDYLIHRAWRSTKYIVDKVQSGAWGLIPDLTAADIEAHSSKQQYTTVWQTRKMLQGQTANFKEDIHEVLEFHDGDRIVIVVDRQWPLASFKNSHPCGGKYHHVFRPTEVLHQMVGKGEIEPIRDLQYEMNQMRSNRYWNALLKMHTSFFYEDGTIDPTAIEIGPGKMNPVNGSPRDVLMEITTGDIPFSGYREEESLKSDIDRTTGISDPAQGTGDAGQTATGVQLVQAAAGVRIQNKTRRLEKEMIASQAKDFVYLNQQRIRENREVRVPMPPTPGEPERRWAWRQIGPAQLAGDFDIIPEGGSTAPDNVPQMRQDAQLWAQLITMSQGQIDPRKAWAEVLKNMGEEPSAVQAFLSPAQNVPPAALDYIKQALVNDLQLPEDVVQNEIQTAVERAVQEAEQQTVAPGAQGMQPGQQQGPMPGQ